MPDQDQRIANVYKYDVKKTWLGYFASIGGAVFFFVVFSYVLSSPAAHSAPLPAVITLYMLPVLFLVGAALSFWLMRPVSVSDAGIETFMFGKRYQFIDWASVTRIERELAYSSFDMQFHHTVQIYNKSKGGWRRDKNSPICFGDYIKHLDRLLEDLNAYIVKYDIPTFDVDRRRETRRAPIFTIADMVQGKSLDGVSTPTETFEVAPRKGIVERLSDEP
jgi:hypothetical protein